MQEKIYGRNQTPFWRVYGALPSARRKPTLTLERDLELARAKLSQPVVCNRIVADFVSSIDGMKRYDANTICSKKV
jgi:hypothetical protein